MVIRNDKTNESIPVDCGKCYQCVAKRTSQWSFRIRQEERISSSSYFITLTYDTQHVPITKNGYMTLNPEDLQKFFKRLRKLNNTKIKYYAVGEYGGKTNRPHYHVIIFNCDIETIEKTWKLGGVHYGQVSGASIGYCLKYLCKDGRIPMHRNDDRIKEFGRMSKGLGASYINEKTIKFHTLPLTILDRVHLVIDEKKVSMPRYYKDKIYNEYQKRLIQYKAKQIEEQLNDIDIERQIQAHLAGQKKLLSSKYKNKFL